MFFLPYEKYEVKTELSVDEILVRLEKNIEPRQFMRFTFWNSVRYKPYQGKIATDGFKINRILGYRNSFRPTIIGKFVQADHAIIIKVRMRMVIFVYLFMLIWFGGIFIAGTVMTVKYFAEGLRQPALPMTILMFIVGYAVMLGGFKYESSKSKKFIEKLLQ